MSPHCVWLVIVGGYDEIDWRDVGGVKNAISTFITDTNRLIMIIELGKIIVMMSSKILIATPCNYFQNDRLLII